jgi:BASS family bile acid:Na+ symporter
VGELSFFLILFLFLLHAWFYPDLWLSLTPFLNPAFAVTMLFVGILIEPEHLKALKEKGRSVGVGLLLQYTLMPLLGFIVSHLFSSPALKLGTILVGVMPGAMASNVVTVWMRGDLLLSVLITTMATLLAPLVILFWFPILSGGISLHLPVLPMARSTLLMVVLPVIGGILFRWRHPRIGEKWKSLARTIASLTIVFIVATVVAENRALLLRSGWEILFGMLILNLLGGTFAFLFTRWIPTLHPRGRYTITIEVAMQNAGLGSVLALTYLGRESALPSALYTPLCVITALLFSLWVRRVLLRMEGNPRSP